MVDLTRAERLPARRDLRKIASWARAAHGEVAVALWACYAELAQLNRLRQFLLRREVRYFTVIPLTTVK